MSDLERYEQIAGKLLKELESEDKKHREYQAKQPLIIHGGLVPYWEKMSDAERQSVLDKTPFKTWKYLSAVESKEVIADEILAVLSNKDGEQNNE